jgi:hypothetical protein
MSGRVHFCIQSSLGFVNVAAYRRTDLESAPGWLKGANVPNHFAFFVQQAADLEIDSPV